MAKQLIICLSCVCVRHPVVVTMSSCIYTDVTSQMSGLLHVSNSSIRKQGEIIDPAAYAIGRFSTRYRSISLDPVPVSVDRYPEHESTVGR